MQPQKKESITQAFKLAIITICFLDFLTTLPHLYAVSHTQNGSLIFGYTVGLLTDVLIIYALFPTITFYYEYVRDLRKQGKKWND